MAVDGIKHHLGNGFYGGWNPSRPDSRDLQFKVAAQTPHPHQYELPGVANIPLLNQGQQGSCEGHGRANIVMFDQQKQGQPIVIPSRAMIYYDARIPEGNTDVASGAQTRDMVAGLVKYGAATDEDVS